MPAGRRRAEPVEILLVEDNPADVRLTREAFKMGRVNTRLSAVRDGEEALDFLTRRGPHAGAMRPDLILLDLNLPRKDGRELLRDIRDDPDLRSIPVIVLTTSNAEQDIQWSYTLKANCYIIKPVDLEEFLSAIRSIEDHWLGIATLPSRR